MSSGSEGSPPPPRRRVRIVLASSDSDSDDGVVATPGTRRKRLRVVESDVESDSSSGSALGLRRRRLPALRGSESDSDAPLAPVSHSPHSQRARPASGSGSDSSDSNSDKCSICLLRLKLQEVGIPQPCEHMFCVDCITEWARHMNTCPVDRLPFDSIIVRAGAGGRVLRTQPVHVTPRPSSVDTLIVEDITTCEICGSGGAEDSLLLCDGCDLGYHMHCLTPPLTQVPVEQWLCGNCAELLDDAMALDELDELLVDCPELQLLDEPRPSPLREPRDVRRSARTTRPTSDQPSTSSGGSAPAPSSRGRARARRRPRAPRRRARHVVLEYEVKGDGKFPIKKIVKRRLKRKWRRRVPRTAARRAHVRASVRAQLAKMAAQDTLQDTRASTGTDLLARRHAAGIPALSLFGEGLPLLGDDDDDGEDGWGHGGAGGVAAATRPTASVISTFRQQSRRKLISVPSPPAASPAPAPAPYLLDSILSSQQLLHSRRSVTSVTVDGTVSITLQHSTRDKRVHTHPNTDPLLSEDGNKRVDVTKTQDLSRKVYGGHGHGGRSRGGWGGGYRGRYPPAAPAHHPPARPWHQRPPPPHLLHGRPPPYHDHTVGYGRALPADAPPRPYRPRAPLPPPPAFPAFDPMPEPPEQHHQQETHRQQEQFHPSDSDQREQGDDELVIDTDKYDPMEPTNDDEDSQPEPGAEAGAGDGAGPSDNTQDVLGSADVLCLPVSPPLPLPLPFFIPLPPERSPQCPPPGPATLLEASVEVLLPLPPPPLPPVAPLQSPPLPPVAPLQSPPLPPVMPLQSPPAVPAALLEGCVRAALEEHRLLSAPPALALAPNSDDDADGDCPNFSIYSATSVHIATTGSLSAPDYHHQLNKRCPLTTSPRGPIKIKLHPPTLLKRGLSLYDEEDVEPAPQPEPVPELPEPPEPPEPPAVDSNGSTPTKDEPAAGDTLTDKHTEPVIDTTRVDDEDTAADEADDDADDDKVADDDDEQPLDTQHDDKQDKDDDRHTDGHSDDDKDIDKSPGVEEGEIEINGADTSKSDEEGQVQSSSDLLEKMTESISETEEEIERSYTPCLDERKPVSDAEPLGTEMISDDEPNHMFSDDERRATPVPAPAPASARNPSPSQPKKKKKESKKENKDKTKAKTKKDKDVSFKKLSKSGKERNYRDRDKDKDDKESKRRSSAERRRRKEKRQDLQRYDVRSVVTDRRRPLKDAFGRDLSPDPNKSSSPSPRRRSVSPRRRSLSPRRRSISPKRRSMSPRRKSITRRSMTPRKKTPRRSISPRKRSISPRRRSISPIRRSISPRRRSISPRWSSPPLRRKSISPRRRSRSPLRRVSVSPPPRRRSPLAITPRKRSISPRKRSISPRRRSPSLRRRSPSPMLGARRMRKRRRSNASPKPKEKKKKKRGPGRKSPKRRTPKRKRKRSPLPEPAWSPSIDSRLLSPRTPPPAMSPPPPRHPHVRAPRFHVPSQKEVFTSGDNILVSVSFNEQQSSVVERRARKEARRRRRQRPAPSAGQSSKPVAIIDLERSPFRELTPSPKHVIVLSDSDHGERDDKAAPPTPPQPAPAAPPTAAPSVASAPVAVGPKTPPSPSQQAAATPPRAPPSPDAYDPFEPTNSPSPAARSPPSPDGRSPRSPAHMTLETAQKTNLSADDVLARRPVSPMEKVLALLQSTRDEAPEDPPAPPAAPAAPLALQQPPPAQQQAVAPRVVLPAPPPKLFLAKPSPIKSNPVKPMLATKLSRLPLPPAADSPYSPGSSDFGDLFSPPTPPSPTAAPSFDALFDKPPRRKGHTAKVPVKFNKKKGKRKEVGVKIDEDSIKILDDLPSSAVEMQLKSKFLKKLNRQERVVEEVKLVLKPYYNKKKVTKDQYKDILRRAVPKICHNKSGEINPTKIQALVQAYVNKARKRHKLPTH